MRRSRTSSGRYPRTRFIVAVAFCLAFILAAGVFIAACGGGGASSTTVGAPGTTAAGGASGAQVTMKNTAFDPVDVTIKAGESVTWTNQDGMNHTVVADNGEFKSGNLGQGSTFSFTFDKAGTYPYHCSIHPSMKGTVTVQ